MVRIKKEVRECLMHVPADHALGNVLSNFQPSDRFDIQHDSARIGHESIGIHEGSRQFIRRCSHRLIPSRVAGPQNVKLIARAHRPEARNEHLLIKV